MLDDENDTNNEVWEDDDVFEEIVNRPAIKQEPKDDDNDTWGEDELSEQDINEAQLAESKLADMRKRTLRGGGGRGGGAHFLQWIIQSKLVFCLFVSSQSLDNYKNQRCR